ncbi:MAG TPA: response regulator transcription factor [Acidimicrobiia bacterium]|nr:response regulator transcription factor [Acidimicrobiia bacterium]
MTVALHPADTSEPVAVALAIAGLTPKLVDSIADPDSGETGDWSVLVVELGDEPMRRLRLIGDLFAATGVPVLVVADPAQFPLVEQATGVADFVSNPPDAAELGVRIRRMIRQEAHDEVLIHVDLELNPLTYQASLGGAPLDLTFMEYELLRFFIENRARVWTREQLLSKVWGYDYYGGARTVDVHVRRLRAKLGEERSSWITTVRSVGYRFG